MVKLCFLLGTCGGHDGLYCTTTVVFFTLYLCSCVTTFLVIPIFLIVFFVSKVTRGHVGFNSAVLDIVIVALTTLPVVTFNFIRAKLVNRFSVFNFATSGVRSCGETSSFGFRNNAGNFLVGVTCGVVCRTVRFFVPSAMVCHGTFKTALTSTTSGGKTLRVLCGVAAPGSDVSTFSFNRTLDNVLLLTNFVAVVVGHGGLGGSFERVIFTLATALTVFTIFIGLHDCALCEFSIFC